MDFLSRIFLSGSNEGTGDDLLFEAVRVASKGSGMPQFFNDKAVIPSVMELGIEEKDAMDYAIVGCVELTTQGNNLDGAILLCLI